MIDPYDSYDPYHPDGADDPEDLPGGPMIDISWLDDEDFFEDEAVQCVRCGQPAESWIYAVGTVDGGNAAIDGYAVCAEHVAA
jgi:hypothetical protein